jgi:hypothetical protein
VEELADSQGFAAALTVSNRQCGHPSDQLEMDNAGVAARFYTTMKPCVIQDGGTIPIPAKKVPVQEGVKHK